MLTGCKAGIYNPKYFSPNRISPITCSFNSSTDANLVFRSFELTEPGGNLLSVSAALIAEYKDFQKFLVFVCYGGFYAGIANPCIPFPVDSHTACVYAKPGRIFLP